MTGDRPFSRQRDPSGILINPAVAYRPRATFSILAWSGGVLRVTGARSARGLQRFLNDRVGVEDNFLEMKAKSRIRKLSPWTWLTLTGCSLSVVVDYWREQMPATLPLAHGTLPNLSSYTPVHSRNRCRSFWAYWAAATVVTVLWEFAQLAGNLVFDPLDILATSVGASITVMPFRTLRQLSYRSADDPQS